MKIIHPKSHDDVASALRNACELLIHHGDLPRLILHGTHIDTVPGVLGVPIIYSVLLEPECWLVVGDKYIVVDTGRDESERLPMECCYAELCESES